MLWFSDSIFDLESRPKDIRKQRKATKFIIQRAEVLFPSDLDSGKNKEDGILSLQAASRRLGTDGMLYLLEQELSRINDDLVNLNYAELHLQFSEIENEIAILHKQGNELEQKKLDFETQFTAQLQEVALAIEQIEPIYNSVTTDT